MTITFMLRLEALAATETASSTDAQLAPLFLRLTGGDLRALEDVYDLCANQIFGVALWRTGSRGDAADVVQQVFLKLTQHAKHLASIRHPRRYILQIAHRASIDLIRKRKKEEPFEELLLLPAKNHLEAEAEARELSSLLHQLPPKQREVLHLHFFIGLTFAEIAKIMQSTTFTAASRCRLALRKLRKQLESKS